MIQRFRHCVYIPTAVTEALPLPSTTSAGKVKVTFLETLECKGETSNSSEVEKDCSRPSACTTNSREELTHNIQTNLVSNISGKSRAAKQEQDFSGHSGEADESRLHWWSFLSETLCVCVGFEAG